MRIFIFIFIFSILFFLSGCKSSHSDIDGQWKRFDTVWKFENGKAYINGTEYEFHTNGEMIFLQNGQKHTAVPYSLSGDSLDVNGSTFNKFKNNN